MPESPSLPSWSSIGWVSTVHSPYGLMVVAGSADVGVEDRDDVGRRSVRGLAIELVVEDRAHRAVGQRTDLDGARGRRFEAIGAERPHQAHDAETGAEALLRMRSALQDQLAQGRRGGPIVAASRRMRSTVQSA